MLMEIERENPELGREDLHVAPIDTEADNQKRSFRWSRNWRIGDSQFSGVGPETPLVMK